jgi:anthranilate synthase component 2
MKEVLHGIAAKTYITDKEEKLFRKIPSPFMTGHYHSWSVNPDKLSPSLKITATSERELVMAVTHKNDLLRGVQFHPESILTEFGKILMSNWLFEC